MKTNYDVIVIGGGINGVGVTLDLASRGFSVCLIEKKTLGSGASSNTSKLVHGGLRYLEYGHVSLVKEALREQDILLKIASRYVKPLSFYMPCYKGLGKPAWMLQVGLMLYDFLFKRRLAKHQIFSKLKAQYIFQDIGLRSEGIQKGFQFEDAIMDDLGLLLGIIDTAKSFNANVLELTQVENVQAFNHHYDVKITQHTGHSKLLSSRCVVQTVGAWFSDLYQSDCISVTPSKGVHLLLALKAKEKALLLFHPRDGRVMFLIPYKGHSLLGTTDRLYQGALDELAIDQVEIDYLLEVLECYFPKLSDKDKKIVDTFVGLRPLVTEKKSSISAVSRDYKLVEEPKGLFHLVGGKYTTYRAMSEATSDAIVRYLGLSPKDFPCQTKDLVIA